MSVKHSRMWRWDENTHQDCIKAHPFCCSLSVSLGNCRNLPRQTRNWQQTSDAGEEGRIEDSVQPKTKQCWELYEWLPICASSYWYVQRTIKIYLSIPLSIPFKKTLKMSRYLYPLIESMASWSNSSTASSPKRDMMPAPWPYGLFTKSLAHPGSCTATAPSSLLA